MSNYSKNNYTKTIIILLVIIFILGSIFVVKTKFLEYKDKKVQEEVSQVLDTIKINQEDITSETTERMLQLKELKKENSDIVGWLEIEGTTINYPVLQGNDNDYYLTHTYKKQYSKNGSIFLGL